MKSGLAKHTVPFAGTKDKSSDGFLRAIVDACISNVAVLDESGTILYANEAWHLFESPTNVSGNPNDTAADFFERCTRYAKSEFDVNNGITLREDIGQILLGKQKEFHRKYCDEFFCHKIGQCGVLRLEGTIDAENERRRGNICGRDVRAHGGSSERKNCF